MQTAKAVTPITPHDAETLPKPIPDFVLEAFNILIQRSFRSGQAVVRQDDAITLIMELAPGLERQEIFDNQWLDVETTYMAAGWKVEYDRPGYCESYQPTFTFRKK